MILHQTSLATLLPGMDGTGRTVDSPDGTGRFRQERRGNGKGTERERRGNGEGRATEVKDQSNIKNTCSTANGGAS